MTTQLQQARDLLFGAAGLQVANVKLFPGAAREASPDMIAAEISSALAQIENGEAEAYEL